MFDADISDLIKYAKDKGFLNRDESVTTEGKKVGSLYEQKRYLDTRGMANNLIKVELLNV